MIITRLLFVSLLLAYRTNQSMAFCPSVSLSRWWCWKSLSLSSDDNNDNYQAMIIMEIMEMIISDLHLHLETWKGGSWMCQQVKGTKTGTFQNYFVRFVLRYQTILFSFQYRSEIDYWDYEILRPPKVEIHRSLLSMVLASVNNQCV